MRSYWHILMLYPELPVTYCGMQYTLRFGAMP
jgi:hypothetical protein